MNWASCIETVLASKVIKPPRRNGSKSQPAAEIYLRSEHSELSGGQWLESGCGQR